ncbi:MAG: PilZ domain-containing protein [Rhodospirillales bacterium]|nr:PilZ domain-containing protein [Rhodospirillales bacterium]
MAEESANKRSQQRNRCLKEGKIIFGNGSFVVDCTIDNLSETGAHLRVQGSSPLPKEFLLVEPSRNLVHKAECVRRTPKGIGIKFNGLFEDKQAAEAYLPKFRR